MDFISILTYYEHVLEFTHGLSISTEIGDLE